MGVSLSYPSRWQSHEQVFSSMVPGGATHVRLVAAPSSQLGPVGGVEIWEYSSERTYLAEENLGGQHQYGSLSDYLATSKKVGTATVAGSVLEGYYSDGENFHSVCFYTQSTTRFYVLCADGAGSISGITPPQRLVLQKASLY